MGLDLANRQVSPGRVQAPCRASPTVHVGPEARSRFHGFARQGLARYVHSPRVRDGSAWPVRAAPVHRPRADGCRPSHRLWPDDPRPIPDGQQYVSFPCRLSTRTCLLAIWDGARVVWPQAMGRATSVSARSMNRRGTNRPRGTVSNARRMDVSRKPLARKAMRNAMRASAPTWTGRGRDDMQPEPCPD